MKASNMEKDCRLGPMEQAMLMARSMDIHSSSLMHHNNFEPVFLIVDSSFSDHTPESL
jgi:hypothetical protein